MDLVPSKQKKDMSYSSRGQGFRHQGMRHLILVSSLYFIDDHLLTWFSLEGMGALLDFFLKATDPIHENPTITVRSPLRDLTS